MLNEKIKTSNSGLYEGGQGVVIRAVNDGVTSVVVPASLIVNDIQGPTTMYPDGNPMCPNYGNDGGFNQVSQCSQDPFVKAQVGAVISDFVTTKIFQNAVKIQDKSYSDGVFYATDSNAADQRCRWFPDVKPQGMYDCPGGYILWGQGFQTDASKPGAGGYDIGNPDKGHGGGGSGCHFSMYNNGIDQFDAVDPNGKNLVSDASCQCNYDLKGTDWSWNAWVDHWIDYGKAKDDYSWMGWLGKKNNGGQYKKAPTFAIDIAACWMNNPRDMIALQNAMWHRRDDWNNHLLPESRGGNTDAARRHWGWNEIPVRNDVVNNVLNWDAILIKLPALLCDQDGWNGQHDSVDCLTDDAKMALEQNLYWYVNNKKLIPGTKSISTRPGSYVTFMKEYSVGNSQYERTFYCEDWTSPSPKYKVVYVPISNSNPSGACYLDYAGGPSPTPPPPTPPPPTPPPPGPAGQFEMRLTGDFVKGVTWCIDIDKDGETLKLADCNGQQSQQFIYDRQHIKSKTNTNLCIDFGFQWDVAKLQRCVGGNWADQKLSYENGYGGLVWHDYGEGCLTPRLDHHNRFGVGSTLELKYCSDHAQRPMYWTGPAAQLRQSLNASSALIV
jgi:hypothetical protein